MIAGGGAIIHDPNQGIYFGILDLAIRGGTTIQGIGLVATRQPDGSKGFSMLVILTVELGNPYPLGMGFFLEGVGGIFALHRTFDETAMRAALPSGQLRNVLFPDRPGAPHRRDPADDPDPLPGPPQEPPLRADGQDRLGLADAGRVRARA